MACSAVNKFVIYYGIFIKQVTVKEPEVALLTEGDSKVTYNSLLFFGGWEEVGCDVFKDFSFFAWRVSHLF